MPTFGDEPGLFRVQFETEPSQALGHGVVKAPGIGFVLEPEDNVVGVAQDDPRKLKVSGLPRPRCERCLDAKRPNLQVDVGQQRRDYRTLTSSYVTCVDDPIVQDACLQPFSDGANDTSVADPVLQETDEPRVINRGRRAEAPEAPSNTGVVDAGA